MKQKKILKLSANENFYGCSPLALIAIRRKIKEAHLYPDYNPVSLEKKLAEFLGVKQENIVIGAGSVRLIDGIIQTFVEHEEEVLTFENSFIAYTQLSEIYKRNCIRAKQTDWKCDVNNLLPLITKNTKVIFIANPNNPTGTIITHKELLFLLKNVPPTIYVVIDEAYGEYVTDKNFPRTLELLKEFSNLIITRTFSKIYGLAGLRIGYAIADEATILALKQNRVSFSINYLLADTAQATLSDKTLTQQSAKANAGQRHYLFTEFKKLGLNTLPSQGNFMYLWFESEAEKKKIYDTLFANGIIICDMKVFGQEQSLRITIGDRKVCKRIIKLLLFG